MNARAEPIHAAGHSVMASLFPPRPGRWIARLFLIYSGIGIITVIGATGFALIRPPPPPPDASTAPAAPVNPAGQVSRPRSPSSEEMPAPTEQDNLRMAATRLNAQRGKLFRKKDLAGVAALYTSDATYVELLPRFEVIRGRAQIQAHFKDIMVANAPDLILNITLAEMTGNGVMLAGGDYSLAVKEGKRIKGHFFQILRQEGGTWRIAMHAFARPELVTPVEASDYKKNGG